MGAAAAVVLAVLLACAGGVTAGFVAMDGLFLVVVGNSSSPVSLPLTATTAASDGWSVANLSSCTANKGRAATKVSDFPELELYYADLSSPNDFLVGVGVGGSVNSYGAFVDPGTICSLSFRPAWSGVFGGAPSTNYLAESSSNPKPWTQVTESLYGTPCTTTEKTKEAASNFWPRAVLQNPGVPSERVIGMTFGSESVDPHWQLFTVTRSPCVQTPPPPPPDDSSSDSRETRLIILGTLGGVFGVGVVIVLVIRRFTSLSAKEGLVAGLEELHRQQIGLARVTENRPHILKSLTEQQAEMSKSKASGEKIEKSGVKKGLSSGVKKVGFADSCSESSESESSDSESSSSLSESSSEED